MTPEQDTYPVFEANQVLTSGHLNDSFKYLDEQNRLTRANLIGIGIVCGLEVRLKGSTIHLSRGCGITSQGYLIIEPEDIDLTSYKPYDRPTDVEYREFNGLEFVELFPAGEEDSILLDDDPDFLKEKVVVLFLELKNEGLRNCSPNNCDDKGSEITAKVRRLLIHQKYIEKVISMISGSVPGLASADVGYILSARLGLPDLRMPRYDVPNTTPVTTRNVLSAFAQAISSEQLVTKLAEALTEAYNAFAPILEQEFSDNPFADVGTNLLFLEGFVAKMHPRQILFLQYYYDFISDLIKAYDQFRWAGLKLMCECCPPDGLFRRHLLLGLFDANLELKTDQYRTSFVRSPAVSCCDDQTKNVIALFRRLVQMIASFKENPPLRDHGPNSTLDDQIRITPSKFGDVPLSDKAIPYYYTQDGDPPLYRLWDPEKTRRARERENLSYRAGEYANKNFVLDPLRFDLEPNNFLRIEGHLGKDINKQVLPALLTLKTNYRLPIEIIALRTGAFDSNIPLDVTQDKCCTQELLTLYKILINQILCPVRNTITSLSDKRISLKAAAKVELPKNDVFPISNYMVKPNTIGEIIANMKAQGIGDCCDPTEERPLVRTATSVVGRLIELSSSLEKDINALDIDVIDSQFKAIDSLYDIISKQDMTAKPVGELNWPGILDWIRPVVDNCKSRTLKALQAEYNRRILEYKKKQFLADFLEDNPGIQHKAGVPIGGTFILVYHGKFEPSEPTRPPRPEGLEVLPLNPEVFLRERVVAHPGIRVPGDIFESGPTRVGSDSLDKILSALPEGTVIADFYLPYICCSECTPMQFVLPKPGLSFSYEVGSCPDAKNNYTVTIKPEGGTPEYRVSRDGGKYVTLKGPLSLEAGKSYKIKIKDSTESESTEKQIVLPKILTIDGARFVQWNDDLKQTFSEEITVSGGVLPYSYSFKPKVGDEIVANEIFEVPYVETRLKANTPYILTVKDRNGCTAVYEKPIGAKCEFPCGGLMTRGHYRLPDFVLRQKAFIRILRFQVGDKKLISHATEDLISFDEFKKEINSFSKEGCEITEMASRSEDWPFNSMQITFPRCLKFVLEVEFRPKADTPASSPVVVRCLYMKEGAHFDERTREERFDYETPVFSIEDADLCSENDKFVPRCRIPKIKVTIDPNDRAMSSSPVARWYWEEMGEGFDRMKSNDPQIKRTLNDILLVGFTENGCFGMNVIK
jgi:hypothetical protein